ncbi:MAG: sigma-70 family RNA polymerase sigma factor [Lachnospiraceae bacterium]|nr:sigma-70 family RNA polymerase sigma factor [Lachnospiraceae bacterium]
MVYINEEKIVRLIDDYQRLIFSICYKITTDYFAAEDLTQETFISAYKNLSNFAGTNEKAYLARIAANKSIDYLRNAANRQIPTEDIFFKNQIDYASQPETAYLQTEILNKLNHCIEKLKPPYDEIATAYYLEEKTPQEIAGARKQNLKTIQTQIYRARENLRKMYEK